MTNDPRASDARPTRFESVGLYLPERIVTTKELVDRLQQPPVFDLQHFTGIESRHERAEHEDTLTLCVEAANDCLSRSKYDAKDLDVIISCSITRVRGKANYYLEPAVSLWVKNELGARTAIHLDVSNACAGMFTGVYLLDSMIKSGAVRNGMVVSGECNSPIYETAVREIDSPFDEQFASLTVGDAATAVIMDQHSTNADQLHYIEMITCSESAYLCLGKPSLKSTGIALYTKNSKLHGSDNLKVWPFYVKKLLADKGTDFASEGFDHLVPHQLGTRFTQKSVGLAEKGLGTKLPPPIHVLKSCGNTSSTSHFVALYLALQDGRVQAGDKLIFYPAASGIVSGCIAVTVSDMGLSA
ncbi:MAG: 3-oxoacyl-[acyl-carrier-protein] synthase III [Kiritimatiellia bacterium]|jgi:3-oxoacyl-[acyl-carrier-protein] synthase III